MIDRFLAALAAVAYRLPAQPAAAVTDATRRVGAERSSTTTAAETRPSTGAARRCGRRLRRLCRAGDRRVRRRHRGVPRRRSRPATSRRRRRTTRQPACTSSGSSRSPAPSATSIPDIDGREGDIPPTEWGGYHRIEKALWIEETTEGLESDDRGAAKRRRQPRRHRDQGRVRPGRDRQGSVDLLAEVSASKITGEEERYSHTDLWDFEANVEGAEAGFEALSRRSSRSTRSWSPRSRAEFETHVRAARPLPRGRRLRPLRHPERGGDPGARTADRRARPSACRRCRLVG